MPAPSRRQREVPRTPRHGTGRGSPGAQRSGRPSRQSEKARTPYASNWRTVLAVDAGLGVAVFVIGLVLLFAWNIFFGAGVGAFGLVYIALVLRRGRRWAALRREAGLDV